MAVWKHHTRIHRMSRRAAPVTSEHGNRRFNEWFMLIEHGEVKSVTRIFIGILQQFGEGKEVLMTKSVNGKPVGSKPPAMSIRAKAPARRGQNRGRSLRR